ncbi:GGDEF domain-containing protein [Photobacterium sp. GB-50]|uniref:sensor domain-containing diguanylate cyclase n=1 Tax=Photobacterium sp. GB-50 TaxID=2022107 RepID=UPI000D170010|nr:GGDEF domain-containing protein [Photobacterium sp. GB-50]PSW74753.1 GGDEF domain-containing protein [Photobacterium sp. GB-50]
MKKHVDLFYQNITKQWGNAHSLRTICELTCRNLMEFFNVHHCQLVVAYKGHWQSLVQQNEAGIQYSFPPVVISEETHADIYQSLLGQNSTQPFTTSNSGFHRVWLPLQRREQRIGWLIIDFPHTVKVDIGAFSQLCTLLATEIDANLLSPTIKTENSSRRHVDQELRNSQYEQDLLLEQLQAMHSISFMLWRTKSIKEMLFIAVDEGKKQLEIDRMAVFLFDKEYRMHGTYGTDIAGNTIDEYYFESVIPEQWYAARTLEEKEYLAVQENTPLYHDLKQVGFGWSAYIALWDEDTPIGWIACDNLLTGRPFRTYHHQLLKQYGFIISQHLVRHQAEDRLKRLNRDLEKRVLTRTEELNNVNKMLEKISRLDPLTNIANRRVFDKSIADEWRRAERHQLPISLLIMDIDHFKQYNDHLGHDAGDLCLKKIAHGLADIERRAGALFARFGGEEFVLLLPGQDSKAAVFSAKKILTTMNEMALPFPQNEESETKKNPIVTLSIGVSSMVPTQGSSYKMLFNTADKALYRAKDEGRNCYRLLL